MTPSPGINTPTVQSTTPGPNSAQPLIPTTPATQPVGETSPPLTQSDAMKQISSSRVAGPIPAGIIDKGAGYVQNDNTGEREYVPRAPQRDVNSEIDDLVGKLMGDPNSRVTQSMGGGVTKTGGLKPKVLDAIIELQKAKGIGQAHKEAAADRDMLARERLDLMKQQIKQAEIAGQDTRALREKMHDEDIYQKDITTAGMDKMTGNFNRERGAFALGNSGKHLNNPEVQQAYIPFITKVKEWEKRNGKPMPLQQRRQWEIDYNKAKGWSE
jgi:hypothetical protein